MRLGLCLAALLLAVAVSGCFSGARSDPPSVSTRLAYVGQDEQVYTVPLEGGDARQVSVITGETSLQAGRRFTKWPTWSPDGVRLAFMRFEVSNVADDLSSIFVVASDGAPTRVFESVDELPIYMAWTPDSRGLTLLTQRGDTLRLHLVDAAHEPRELATGSPLYFAWSPDSQRLLLHVNGDHRTTGTAALTLLRFDSAGEASEPSSARPTDFRAPAWSADGSRMAFVMQLPGGQAALSVQELGAQEAGRLAVVGDEPAFLWSPTGPRLAFSSRTAGALLYEGIETINADGGNRLRVTDTEVIAFYWSPDGKKLAYAALDPRARSLAWFVSEPDGKNRRELATFLPSEDQFFMFRFFDQYAQSHAVWSPDSKYLVYAGAAPGAVESSNGTGRTSSQPTASSRVFVAPVDGSAAPRSLVDGRIGVWPVPTPRR